MTTVDVSSLARIPILLLPCMAFASPNSVELSESINCWLSPRMPSVPNPVLRIESSRPTLVDWLMLELSPEMVIPKRFTLTSLFPLILPSRPPL